MTYLKCYLGENIFIIFADNISAWLEKKKDTTRYRCIMIKQWTTTCRKLVSWKAMTKSTSGLHEINQRQARRTQARWSGVFHGRQENISKPSLLISKKPTPFSRGENITSDSMLALLDFCEDAITPFVSFLKNDLEMKRASKPEHR